VIARLGQFMAALGRPQIGSVVVDRMDLDLDERVEALEEYVDGLSERINRLEHDRDSRGGSVA
jgi:hypothetical protein